MEFDPECPSLAPSSPPHTNKKSPVSRVKLTTRSNSPVLCRKLTFAERHQTAAQGPVKCRSNVVDQLWRQSVCTTHPTKHERCGHVKAKGSGQDGGESEVDGQ